MKVDKNVIGVVIRNEYKRAIDKEQKKISINLTITIASLVQFIGPYLCQGQQPLVSKFTKFIYMTFDETCHLT